MKTKNVILIIFLSLVVMGAGWLVFKQGAGPRTHDRGQKDIYYCPMHPHYTSDRSGDCPICTMKLVKKDKFSRAAAATLAGEKKILYWTDPMIPGYKASGPGKSPMGMDLIPVYEGLDGQSASAVPGYATVTVDARKQQLMGVRTAPVSKRNLTRTIHAYGYVAHDLELFDAEIEYIEAWQDYFTFLARRPTIDEYRADWRDYYRKDPPENRWRSDAKRKAMQRLIRAEYELIHMGLTESQMKDLRQVKYGQPWSDPSLLFFEKNQPFWIYAQVLENDLGFIAPGQKVRAVIPAYGEITDGTVKYVTPFIDPQTRTSRVRIALPHYKGELSINMFVNVDIPVELDEGLVIPREAIMDTGLHKVVFVQIHEGIFEPRYIETGFAGDGMVVVKSGLKEGDVIVVSGNFLLDSESRLQGSLAVGGSNHD